MTVWYFQLQFVENSNHFFGFQHQLVSEDVVSKQLREAAVSEDDPQLRERLWEEYRNYNRF
jgi:hypothetical protein